MSRQDTWAYAAVQAIAYHSISLGCAANPMRFCPDGDVGRDEMAVFLERAMRGFGYPFAPTGTLFSDVPMTHWAVGPIEGLFTDGITLGCGASPLRYCPDTNVTRAEMAIFLLKARHGPNYNPGGATGLVFADVPANHWAAAWIEEFAGLGYTSGCRSPPLEFCPDDLGYAGPDGGVPATGVQPHRAALASKPMKDASWHEAPASHVFIGSNSGGRLGAPVTTCRQAERNQPCGGG